MCNAERPHGKASAAKDPSLSGVSNHDRFKKRQKRTKDARVKKSSEKLANGLERTIALENNRNVVPTIQNQSNPNKQQKQDNFHHKNIFGRNIEASSNTPPEDSMFYIMSTFGRKPSNRLWNPERINRPHSLRLDTLLTEAEKWVDPVLYTGDLRELDWLKGRRFIDAIRPHLRKFYRPFGTFWHEYGNQVLLDCGHAFESSLFKPFVCRNRIRWSKRFTVVQKVNYYLQQRELRKKKKLKKKKPRREWLGERTLKCSSLHWSSTPETQPVAANLGAWPCSEIFGSASEKGRWSCFWWEKPKTSNEQLSEKPSEESIGSAPTMNVPREGEYAESRDKEPNVEQETLGNSDDMDCST